MSFSGLARFYLVQVLSFLFNYAHYVDEVVLYGDAYDVESLLIS